MADYKTIEQTFNCSLLTKIKLKKQLTADQQHLWKKQSQPVITS